MTTTPDEGDPTAVPLAPFGATVKGAADLVPEARLYPGDAPIPEGSYGITVTQVARWVEELTDAVSMTLDGWERLSDVPVLDAVGGILADGDRTRFLGSVRTVIHNGAASYLEAARHPERTDPGAGYAGVLWERYTTGLDRLAGWLTARLAAPDAGDTPEEPASGGVRFSFPEPLIGDRLRF